MDIISHDITCPLLTECDFLNYRTTKEVLRGSHKLYGVVIPILKTG